MAVCLQYQSVYVKRESVAISAKLQIVAAVALLGVLVVRVWSKLEATDLGYQLARERQLTVSLDMEKRELELQRSILVRPDSLAKAARERVGLVDHKPDQTIRISY
jgi:hypothetical protein